jgi:hypothetical protein
MGIESLLQQNLQNTGLAGVDRLARNAMFPQGQMDKTQYAVPSQMPTSAETIRADYDAPTNAYTGLPDQPFAKGGIATLRYDGEDGSQVQATEENKPATMAELADAVKQAYRTNANYDQLWKDFAATKEQDPQAWYRHQLDFLGNQVGWQQGQNTGERAAALQPQIQDTINQAKAAGLKDLEISNILGSSSQEANRANQERIAREAAEGKGWVNQNIPGGWTTVGAAAALAAAPYLAPEFFAGAGATEGAWGLSPELAAELGLEGSTSGLSTSGALGSQTLESMGLNTTAGGLTAKQALGAKMAMDLMNSGNAQAGAGGYAPQTVASAPTVSTIPQITRSGVTGYYGASEAPDYRSIAALTPKTYLSKLDNMPSERLLAAGGIAGLGSYSDGGHLLKGPGDGMSDNIPATISGKQPARLADGEFVIPADVVSHLGNGSTDAGAKQLYKMMDKIRQARTGNKKQGKRINPNKFLP